MSDDDNEYKKKHNEDETPIMPPPGDSSTQGDGYSHFISYLKEHPAFFISIIYIQVSAVGIIYIWRLFLEFNVNVFDFAEANDFLLAAFKQPLAYFSAVGILIFFIVYLLLLYKHVIRFTLLGRISIHRRYAWVLILVVGFFYTFAPAFYLAGIDAKKIKNGEFGHVSLELNKQISGETPLVINNKLSLIGSTEKFILFYTHNDDMCIVVPLTNIASLRLSANSTIDKYHRFLPF